MSRPLHNNNTYIVIILKTQRAICYILRIQKYKYVLGWDNTNSTTNQKWAVFSVPPFCFALSYFIITNTALSLQNHKLLRILIKIKIFLKELKNFVEIMGNIL